MDNEQELVSALEHQLEVEDEKVYVALDILDNMLVSGVSKNQMIALEEINPDFANPLYPAEIYTEEPSMQHIEIALENILTTVMKSVWGGIKAVGEFIAKIFNWIVEGIKKLFGGVSKVKEAKDAVDELKSVKDYEKEMMQALGDAGLTDEEMAHARELANLGDWMTQVIENIKAFEKGGEASAEAAKTIVEFMDKENDFTASLGGMKSVNDVKDQQKKSEELNKEVMNNWIDLYGQALDIFSFIGEVNKSDFTSIEKDEKEPGEGLKAYGAKFKERTDELAKAPKPKETDPTKGFINPDFSFVPALIKDSEDMQKQIERDVKQLKAAVEASEEGAKSIDTEQEIGQMVKELRLDSARRMKGHRAGASSLIIQYGFYIRTMKELEKKAIKQGNIATRLVNWFKGKAKTAQSGEE